MLVHTMLELTRAHSFTHSPWQKSSGSTSAPRSARGRLRLDSTALPRGDHPCCPTVLTVWTFQYDRERGTYGVQEKSLAK